MAIVPISLLSIAPPQRNVSRMVRKASMRFAVDCHPIYFHLLDESSGGRVDLGTSSRQFKTFRPCRDVDSMLMCSMRFAVDCHPIYFHLLDESSGGRVDLGTSSRQFKTFRPCRNVDSMLMCSRAEANGGLGGGAPPPPPADHLSENFALLSEFLCSK